MTLVTIYQANNPETLPVNLATPEIVLESELPDRLQHTTGITYEGDDRDGYYTLINQPLSVNGNISSTNLTTMNTNLQTIMGTLTNVSYDSGLLRTIISGELSVGILNGNKIGTPTTFLYSNYSPFIPVCDSTGVIELGRHLDFHNVVDTEDYKARLSCIGTNMLEIAGTSSMRMTRIDTSVGMALRTSYTLMNFYKSDAATSMLTLDATTNAATFLGNIVAPSLNGNKIGASNEGFVYTTDAPYIPVCKANGITEIGYRLDFHLADATFRDFSAYISNTALNILRVYGTTTDSGTIESNAFHLRTNGEAVRVRIITNGYQNICVYNTAGTFVWVMDSDGTNGLERWSTVRINASNASTRTTAMTYTAGTPDNTTIAGDLTVTGSIHGTLAGSQTITHKTKYTGTLTPGCFVESTGLIYREPPKVGATSIWNEPTEEGQTGYYTTTQTTSSLSPYENCISMVKLASTFSNKIIGICTEIIDHEFCKFATHGDCLVKCDSATYTIGDILVPSLNGYAKKGTASDVMNCMCSMIPRLKVTSVETDQIDPECVVGFVTI